MKKVITVIISILIVVLSLSFMFSNRIEFSENENRYLEKYPKLTIKNIISGEYTKKLNNYLSDHFVLRNSFMNLKVKVDKLLGKKKINDIYIGSDNYLLMDYNIPKNSDRIIENLNNFYKQVNYVNTELMLVPTSIEINKDKLPKYVDSKQLNELNYIYTNIVFNKINIYDTLKANNNKYQMFYRLDHHWTTYGAYYAYLEYCKSNNITSIPITDFDVYLASSGFKGTLYSKVLDESLPSDYLYLFKYNGNYTIKTDNNTSNSLYNFESLNTKDKYSVFLNGNHPLVEIKNNQIKNNKKLVVIKDSYANSIIPFLINHFKEVDVIDPRYYNESIIEYVKSNKITDILILYNMNTIDTDNGIINLK